MHNNRAVNTGVRGSDAQHTHVHLQVVQEATVVTLPPGLPHGDVSRNGLFSDVHGSTAGTGRRQGSDADQLCVLHSRIAG